MYVGKAFSSIAVFFVLLSTVVNSSKDAGIIWTSVHCVEELDEC